VSLAVAPVPVSLAAQAGVTLTWVTPSQSGVTFTGYQVEASSDAGSTWTVAVSSPSTMATSYTATGLQVSTTYDYRIAFFYTSVGSSLLSPYSNAVTVYVAPVTPSMPSVKIGATKTGLVLMTLRAPVVPGTSPIVKYQYSTNGHIWTTATIVKNGTIAVKDLRAGHTYLLSLRAVNASGPGQATKATKVHVL